ncbi:hypothetical protein [Gottfriedia solisilvae]|uniref:DUF4083 domain-containing protein n=1 Tax=Gottfriedia solisilvae TaxID=1516104 RepID=A0A8J3AHG5_9BACI|nr:hypothetical protein [Gottfriedia solisilvae]GGI12909.1 hypothetical protein GCM10007380_15270 [Gottfriedia solisilvae]
MNTIIPLFIALVIFGLAIFSVIMLIKNMSKKRFIKIKELEQRISDLENNK